MFVVFGILVFVDGLFKKFSFVVGGGVDVAVRVKFGCCGFRVKVVID